MTTSRIATGLAVIVCALAAGCGGDDEGEAGSGGGAEDTSITKAEFVKEANAICRQGNADITAAAERFTQEPTEEELVQFAEEDLIPNVRQQLEDIRALGFPEGDGDTLTAILDDAETALDGIEEDPAAVTGDPFADVNPRLADYGLSVCAQ